MNEKVCNLLKEVINNNYHNIKLDSMYYDDNEFYYEFQCAESISENDFELLENEIRKLDSRVYVKLLRISGVYYKGDKNNEMITRIVGKAFN